MYMYVYMYDLLLVKIIKPLRHNIFLCSYRVHENIISIDRFWEKKIFSLIINRTQGLTITATAVGFNFLFEDWINLISSFYLINQSAALSTVNSALNVTRTESGEQRVLTLVSLFLSFYKLDRVTLYKQYLTQNRVGREILKV